MIAVLKVLLTLTLVIILLQRKISIGHAMLAGASLLFVICSPQWTTLEAVGKNVLFTPSTWEILLALYLVMCLEYQLRTNGIIDGLMAASRNLLKSDKVLLALMPAFLGFLPSLGGAIFSAPLVEAAGKPYDLSPERKTAINYWFRHVWECTNPIIPALLLGSQIVQVSVGSLIANMLWVSALGLLLGWFFYIYPLESQATPQTLTATAPEKANNYRYFLMSAGPIVANFLLVVGFDLGPAASMLLVVVTMTLVLRLQPGNIISMLKQAFDRKMLWGVIGIIFFQHMLKQTGIIGEVASVLQNSGIPMMLVIGAVGFLAGLLTGTSQGVVAITFPLVAAVYTGNVTAAVVAYVAGNAGQMLSPAHLCLLVTLDYFKADFLKSLRTVTAIEIFLLLALSVKTTFI
jgi:integral membrane protein (TIGR00529 family)